MQLVLRGQQQEAGGGHPGVARWRGEVQERRGHSQARKQCECGEACFQIYSGRSRVFGAAAMHC